jgi:hypothetical protein
MTPALANAWAAAHRIYFLYREKKSVFSTSSAHSDFEEELKVCNSLVILNPRSNSYIQMTFKSGASKIDRQRSYRTLPARECVSWTGGH